MVETLQPEIEAKSSDNFNVPAIFIEDRDGEVNGQIISGSNSDDHYAPSVRNVYVSKPVESTSSFGFHLSRSKWDPYPYISRVDNNSFASVAGLKEGDCVLEVNESHRLILKCAREGQKTESKTETKATGEIDSMAVYRFFQV